MKIGVIGSGISGLVSALTLQERFEVSLFEKNSKLGGHSNTVTIEQENKKYSVETGFIVLNDKNYPQAIINLILCYILISYRQNEN